MAKIRHIVFNSMDPERLANFYVEVMGLQITHRAKNGGISLTDGHINLVETLCEKIAAACLRDKRVVAARVRVEKPGVYYGQCNQICGVNHAFMPISIEVLSKEQYTRWLEQAKKQFASGAPTNLALAETN